VVFRFTNESCGETPSDVSRLQNQKNVGTTKKRDMLDILPLFCNDVLKNVCFELLLLKSYPEDGKKDPPGLFETKYDAQVPLPLDREGVEQV